MEKRNKILKIKDPFLQPTPVTSLPYNPLLKVRARELRQDENLSEVLFWIQVTKGRFHPLSRTPFHGGELEQKNYFSAK